MSSILLQSLFANHPLLEKVFMLVGGGAIMAHGVWSLWPRLLAFGLSQALSNNHPVIQAALIAEEPNILNAIQAAKIQVQASIDAAKVQSAVPAAPATPQTPAAQ